ncbi:helix-turn-helix transcriptional regulator [Actinomycetospora sp. C-140]
MAVVGRTRERELLAAAADPARPDGAVLVLHGEPGSGKSTLLDEVVDASPRRVLRTDGVEGEAVLPFAAAADLLLPLREHLGVLPGAQRAALEVALALRTGAAGSPLAVCAGALGLLAAAADVTPLLVVVDDFPWIDGPSQQVLLFLARRLASERVTLLLAARSEVPVDPALWRLPTVELGPLSPQESRELVATLPVRTSARVLEAIVERCGGNPLAVVEIARSAGPQLLAEADGTTVLPPGSALERTWSAALDALPSRTGSALAVLAHSRTTRRADLEPVLADLGLHVDDLTPAARRGLVARDGDELRLRHALLRPLVAERSPVVWRRRVLRALAHRAGPDLEVWYLAEAAEPPDPGLADRLADAAKSARERAALGSAALTWARAADFTAEPELRAGRLLAAATDAVLSGDAARAVAWCDQALAPGLDVLTTADAEALRARALTWLDPVTAAEQAVRAGDAVLPVDRERAVRLYGEAVMPLTMAARLAEAETMVDRARDAVGGVEPDLMTLATGAHTHALVGRADDARAGLDAVLRQAGDVRSPWEAPGLAVAAQTAVYLERRDDARRLVEPLAAAARDGGAPLMLAFVLGVRAELDWWTGRWPAAYADATECVAWAEELHQTNSRAFGLMMQARIEAARGEIAASRAHADEALRASAPAGVDSLLGYTLAASGAGALAAGDVETAVARLDRARRVTDEQGARCAAAVPLAGDLVDATVRAGERAAAEEAVAWVDDLARHTGSAYATAVAARGRGLLADDPDAAEESFAAALRAHGPDTPFERARTVLAHAEARRRWRRPGAARPLLLEAEATFAALGAHPWAERARTELAATGQRPAAGEVPEPGPSLDVLTPQEFQVARGVGDGLSNVEVAAALFVSRKTVEAHVTRIFRKLGVRSRTQLAAEITRRQQRDEGTP